MYTRQLQYQKLFNANDNGFILCASKHPSKLTAAGANGATFSVCNRIERDFCFERWYGIKKFMDASFKTEKQK